MLQKQLKGCFPIHVSVLVTLKGRGPSFFPPDHLATSITQNHCQLNPDVHFFGATKRQDSDDAQNFRYCNLLQDHQHLMIVSAGQ
jgi:hypothetical protein